MLELKLFSRGIFFSLRKTDENNTIQIFKYLQIEFVDTH